MERRAAEREIHLALTFDDNYWRPASVVMHSAIEGAARDCRIIFHIVGDNLTCSNKDALCAVAKGAELHFYEVSNHIRLGGEYSRDYFNDSILLRLHLGDVLPDSVQRVIYLDSDVLVRTDLSALWEQDLNGHPVGAVHDEFLGESHIHTSPLARFHACEVPLDQRRYFSSGVMLIDLESWRGYEISRRARKMIAEGARLLELVDQDVLNIMFCGNWQELDGSWNRSLWHSVTNPRAHDSSVILGESRILHYNGELKPWMYPLSNAAYVEYAMVARSIGWEIVGRP